MELAQLLLVDDHPMILSWLSRVLEPQPDMKVVGCAINGLEAVHLAMELKPDVVLMDCALPKLTGAEATRRILESVPDAKVLALSQFSDYATVSSMLAAGAKGYLTKTTEKEELFLAIRTVAAGYPYISPDLTVQQAILSAACTEKQLTDLADLAVQIVGPPKSLDQLSSREREVLRLVSEGKTAKETAGALGISRRTVEFHIYQTKEKLGIDTLAGLVKYAIRARLTKL
ncbi:MAG: response regulator transcription factor [bacterium]